MASNYDSIGFVGLGIMGLPMLENLLNKLPHSTRFYVYDVSKPQMETLATQYPTKVEACQNAREVADKSVAKPTRSPPL